MTGAPDLILVRHDAAIIGSAFRALARRPADLLTAVAALALACIGLSAGWSAVQQTQMPRAFALGVLATGFMFAFAERRIVRRLGWFADETPLAAEALRRGPRGSYRALGLGVTTTLAAPLAAGFASKFGDPRLLGLALIAAAAGLFAGRIGLPIPFITAPAGLRPVPRSGGAALLDELMAARQTAFLPLPTRAISGLARILLTGALAGACACLAAMPAAPVPLRLAGGVAALLLAAMVTQIDVALARSAPRLGFSAWRTAGAYLRGPAAALVAMLLVAAAVRPPDWTSATLAFAAVTAMFSLYGLLRLFRTAADWTSLSSLVVQLEVAAILLATFFFPPLGVAVAAERVIRASRTYRAAMWQAD